MNPLRHPIRALREKNDKSAAFEKLSALPKIFKRKKISKRLPALLLALTLALPGLASCQKEEEEPKYREISKEEYRDRTTAGFLGQIVGFLSGNEFIYRDGALKVAMPEEWWAGICKGAPYSGPNPILDYGRYKLNVNPETGKTEVWIDDDFSIDIVDQYILRDSYEKYGRITSYAVTEGWVNYDVWDLGGGNRYLGAYRLMLEKGYLPEYAGSSEFGNRFSHQIEPYIGNETLGMVTAGMPEAAQGLTGIFAQATGDRDAVIWAKFFASLYSLAYFESDIPEMLREAKKLVPESCVGKTLEGCFELYERYPDDWRAAVRAAVDRFLRTQDREETGKQQCNATVNAAFIVLALLYGGGDYVETCKIIALSGFDGDSTSAVCMGIMGVLCGMEGLPEEANALVWQDGEGIINNKQVEGSDESTKMVIGRLPERLKIAEIAALYQENFELVLLECGGKIEDDRYLIPVRDSGEFETLYFEDFEGEGIKSYATEKGDLRAVAGGFEGSSARLSCKKGESEAEATLSLPRLEKGKTYRMTLYCRTSPASCAAEFTIRSPGEEGVYCSLVEQAKWVKRSLTFTSTGEEEEFSVRLFSVSDVSSYVEFDDFTLFPIVETPSGVSLSLKSQPGADGSFTGSVIFEAIGSAPHELCLKLVYATSGPFSGSAGFDGFSDAPASMNATLAIGNERFGGFAFHKTTPLSSSSSDVLYLPILLPSGSDTDALPTTTLTLRFSGSLFLLSAEIVSVKELV